MGCGLSADSNWVGGGASQPSECDLWLTFWTNVPEPLCQVTVVPQVPLLLMPFVTVRSARYTLGCAFKSFYLSTNISFTEKENPYEDVDLKRKSLGQKLEISRSWTMDKKLSSPPQVRSSLRSSMLHCIKTDSLSAESGTMLIWEHFAMLPFARSPLQSL